MFLNWNQYGSLSPSMLLYNQSVLKLQIPAFRLMKSSTI